MVFAGLALQALCLSFHKKNSFLLRETGVFLKENEGPGPSETCFCRVVFTIQGCSRVLVPVLVLPGALSASSKEKEQMQQESCP